MTLHQKGIWVKQTVPSIWCTFLADGGYESLATYIGVAILRKGHSSLLPAVIKAY